jgi:DNA modification methylase
LDPFLGSATTSKVAKELGRNSFGYELDLELRETILKKLNHNQSTLTGDMIEVIERQDAQRLRAGLQKKVKTRRSVAEKPKTAVKT